MDEQKKQERVNLLTSIGEEVYEEVLAEHVKRGGDENEIVFNRNILANLVNDYSGHLEDYRARHLGPGKLVDGDKIAAFTGTLIMRYNVFESATGEVNTPVAALVNQTFAIRVARLFLQQKKFNFRPPDEKQLYHCFTKCYDHDPAMVTWTVATMAQHLRGANIKEEAYAD